MTSILNSPSLCPRCQKRADRIDQLREELDQLERLVAECAEKNAIVRRAADLRRQGQ